MKFPIAMCKGDAHTPQRFWSYTTARNYIDYEKLTSKGYVKSTNQ